MLIVKGKEEKRIWIDSQTEEEMLWGIQEAKELKEYNSLADAAYLRAKEDYLIGINFSRLLTIIFGRRVATKLNEEKISISVGRVMTCVLGMIVSREREIKNFVKNFPDIQLFVGFCIYFIFVNFVSFFVTNFC